MRCFEDDEDIFKDTVAEMMEERNDEGKTALDIAAMLGRTDMMKELISRGADVNNITKRGALLSQGAQSKVPTPLFLLFQDILSK